MSFFSMMRTIFRLREHNNSVILGHGQAKRLLTGQAGKATGLSVTSPAHTQAQHTSGFPLQSLARLRAHSPSPARWSHTLKLIFLLVIPTLYTFGQTKIAFVSDTQAPMWIEDVFLKSNNNEKATALLFSEIVNQKPSDLFILGDVVTLGYKEKKWKKMDTYIQSCRDAGIETSALLGNHDVMSNAKKGEKVFQKRFPSHARTGFVKITDSVAVVLLNSNFKKLSREDIATQQSWLKSSLQKLDNDPAIQVIVVSCHHAPYSNSKIVGSAEESQKYFVPLFYQSPKSKLFITGHSHAFEYFKREGKDFLVIGGGGGIHQPLKASNATFSDLASQYKPMFHYLTMTRSGKSLQLVSHFLKNDFSGFEAGYSINISNESK